jgi:hypothetical protein
VKPEVVEEEKPILQATASVNVANVGPANFLAVALAAAREAESHRVEVIGPIRAFFCKIAVNKLFENGIVILILGNCVSLAAFNPMQAEDSGYNYVIGWIDNIFNFAFTFEIIVRMVSCGSVPKHFTSSWNIFDFVIVMIGYSAFLGTSSSGAGGLRALRAMRALRPLRTVGQVKSLRTIANSFVDAMPMLMSVIGVLFFYLVVFAICGMALFMDGMHHRWVCT